MSAVTRIGAGVAALAVVLGAAACADTVSPPPGPTTGSPMLSPGPMMRPPTGASGGDVDDANRGPGGMMGGYPTTATAIPHVGSVAGEGLDRATEISLQAAVDQGAQPWRLDPQMVALAFTRARFGWMMPRTEPLAAGSVTVDDGVGGAISVRPYQPARTGPGGIWTVTGGTWLR